MFSQRYISCALMLSIFCNISQYLSISLHPNGIPSVSFSHHHLLRSHQHIVRGHHIYHLWTREDRLLFLRWNESCCGKGPYFLRLTILANLVTRINKPMRSNNSEAYRLIAQSARITSRPLMLTYCFRSPTLMTIAFPQKMKSSLHNDKQLFCLSRQCRLKKMRKW